jgi:hypothetical protein
MLGNGFGQGFQLLLVKILTGLAAVGFYLMNGQQLIGGVVGRNLGKVLQQRAQALAQTFFGCHKYHPFFVSFS